MCKKCAKKCAKWRTFEFTGWITGKRLKIDGCMLQCVWQALNPLSIRVTFTAIVPGVYPEEAKMCLRLSWRSQIMCLGWLQKLTHVSLAIGHLVIFNSVEHLFFWCTASLRKVINLPTSSVLLWLTAYIHICLLQSWQTATSNKVRESHNIIISTIVLLPTHTMSIGVPDRLFVSFLASLISLLSYAADKQTDKQTDRQTDRRHEHYIHANRHSRRE